jgi:hypothetical protein
MNLQLRRGGRRLSPNTKRASRPGASPAWLMRRICGPFETANVWPPLAHVWPTCVRAATAWRVGQRWRDLGKSASNRHQKQKSPPRQCRAGLEGKGGVRCYGLIR